MRITSGTLVASCALAVLALAGCKKEATGQVAAVVNGEEITLQEINTEIGQAALPKNADRKPVQQAALQRIIDRRLVAQTARTDGIDKDIEYVTRQRQVDELLLIQLLGQKVSSTLRVPDTATVDKFIAERPAMFAERTAYALERLQFDMPANPKVLEQLKDDHSMDAVVLKLNSLGIAFKRDQTQLNSAQLPPEFMTRVKALPPGEPFLVPENGVVTIGVIIASKVVPLTGADARPVAVQLMRNEEMRKILEQRLKTARGEAKIEYQSGFAPTKPATPAKP